MFYDISGGAHMKSRYLQRAREAGFRAFGSQFPFDAPEWVERFAFERFGMVGRHRHGGGGRFGDSPGGMGGGMGGFGGEDGMPRGRKFSSDDLQLLLLAMLAEAPRH